MLATWAPARAAHAAAPPTASVLRHSPARERTQKGITSATIERSPLFPHTQRRLSSKEGTVPTATATTLAQEAPRTPVATRNPSTVRLVAVATPDTAA